MRARTWVLGTTMMLFVVGMPAVGPAATITVKVKEGTTVVCSPNPSSLAGECGPKLTITNSSAGGTAKAEILYDTTSDRLKLSKVKFKAKQDISNYTIVIEATGLQGPPDGDDVAYRTTVGGIMSQSDGKFKVSSFVKGSSGTTYATLKSPELDGPDLTWTSKTNVAQAVNGSRSILLELAIVSLEAGQSIDLMSKVIQVRNEDPGDDPDPRDLPSTSILKDVIQGSSREACLGIYTNEQVCYGVHIK